MTLLFIIGILFCCYTALILFYTHSWNGVAEFNRGHAEPSTTISVIIPARNEEKNIAALLRALEGQSYNRNLFEVIVIDDHSEDLTDSIVERFENVKLIKLATDRINSYKKKAVETGIAAATGKLIVCTDADCIPPKEWLKTIAAYYEKYKPVFIAAPVVFTNKNNTLETFQALDFLVLQGITGAVAKSGQHSLSNGANLAYEKEVFEKVGGFRGVDQLASGDDLFLMQKIGAQYPNRMGYLKSKDAIVSTAALSNFESFIDQRIRWASKTKQYKDYKLIAVLGLVYLFNLSFLFLLIGSFWHTYYLPALLVLLIGKFLVESIFVQTIAPFFGKEQLVKKFYSYQLLHISYMIVAGFFGLWGKYQWKGRRVH
jgi:cellulose synthase/poly-beta-1,6-N-acetylglucosamine synthase-like glycosyltransferase